MKSERSSLFVHWAPAKVTGLVDGRPWTIRGWGGSDTSFKEAEERALAWAKAGLARAQNDDEIGGYEYARQRIKEELLERLGSDPLYVLLCRAQGTFRARLTPKPWRCDHTRPPVKFPFRGPEEERHQRQWEKSYSRQTRGYAVCRLIHDQGKVTTHAAVEPILALHEREVLGNGPLDAMGAGPSCSGQDGDLHGVREHKPSFE